jgi:hypothetical protein
MPGAKEKHQVVHNGRRHAAEQSVRRPRWHSLLRLAMRLGGRPQLPECCTSRFRGGMDAAVAGTLRRNAARRCPR